MASRPTLKSLTSQVRALAARLDTLEAKPAANTVAPAAVEIGLTLQDNEPKRLVLVSIDATEPCTHAEAMAFAKQHNAELPSRIDALVLFSCAKGRFKTEKSYWTSQDFPGDSAYAFHQWFYDGYQNFWPKDLKLRVCLVRRLPL